MHLVPDTAFCPREVSIQVLIAVVAADVTDREVHGVSAADNGAVKEEAKEADIEVVRGEEAAREEEEEEETRKLLAIQKRAEGLTNRKFANRLLKRSASKLDSSSFTIRN